MDRADVEAAHVVEVGRPTHGIALLGLRKAGSILENSTPFTLSRAKEAQDAQDLSLPASEIATDIHT